MWGDAAACITPDTRQDTGLSYYARAGRERT